MASEKKVLLFLGGISKEKGTDFLLEVFQEIYKKDENVELWIAGNWNVPKKGFLKRILSFFGIESPGMEFFNKVESLLSPVKNRVKIFGEVEDVVPLLKKCSLLLFPCRTGHFARPVIEAAFLKKPSVVSKIKPLDEILVHKATGLALKFGNKEIWACNILNLLNDLRDFKRMSENAKRVAKKYFSLEDQVKRVEKLYQQVLF